MFVSGFIGLEGALWTLKEGIDESLDFPMKWTLFDASLLRIFHFDF